MGLTALLRRGFTSISTLQKLHAHRLSSTDGTTQIECANDELIPPVGGIQTNAATKGEASQVRFRPKHALPVMQCECKWITRENSAQVNVQG